MTKRDTQVETKSDWVRPSEAAEISGLRPFTLTRMAEAGKLTFTRPGGTHRRYLRSEIEALAAPREATK